MSEKVQKSYHSGRNDKRARVWNDALDGALATGSSAADRLHGALVVIDAHLDGIVRAPSAWGDTMSAEIAFQELLYLRAVLVGVEPVRWGGEALAKAKRRAFKSDNGPASNWIGRDEFEKLTPLLEKALRAERTRMGVPSTVPPRRAKKTAPKTS